MRSEDCAHVNAAIGFDGLAQKVFDVASAAALATHRDRGLAAGQDHGRLAGTFAVRDRLLRMKHAQFACLAFEVRTEKHAVVSVRAHGRLGGTEGVRRARDKMIVTVREGGVARAIAGIAAKAGAGPRETPRKRARTPSEDPASSTSPVV